MTRTARAALAVVVVASAVSIGDAVYGGITGRAAIWDDTRDVRWASMLVNVLLVATFALLAAVLVQSADGIDGQGRVTRWLRRLLLFDLSVLAAVFVFGVAMDRYPGPVSAVAGIAFILMFLLGVALGFALLRRPGYRTQAVLLIAPLALLPAAFAIGAFAPDWVHPGYAETSLYVGLALLGRPAVAREPLREAVAA